MNALVKICGVTSVGDARAAVQAGADYIGVIVDIEQSPRCINPAAAAAVVDAAAGPVICLSDKPAEQLLQMIALIKPAGVQLIGTYSPQDIREIKKTARCAVWKTLHIPKSEACSEGVPGRDIVDELFDAGVDTIVLDTLVKNRKGGTGQTCDWNTAAALVSHTSGNVFLAGGITPENAAQAVRKVSPAGLDVSSGVEKHPGKKDIKKVTRLIRAVREG